MNNIQSPPKVVTSFKPLFKMLIDRGMKHKELAELAGISAATITKMSKDGCYVNSDILVKICKALGCTFDDILCIKQIDSNEPASEECDCRTQNENINDVSQNAKATTVISDANAEYELLPREKEIAHFIYERIHHHRDNPPMYLLRMIMNEYGSQKPNMLMGEAKMLIPTDRYYSLVLNEVFEKFGKDGYAFDKKHIPFSLIESGQFELPMK